MVKATSKTPLSAPPRRKQTLNDPIKKEKGRSRNACDRCKQKKVKCDGEGQRVCSICREGDYQCTYAQRPHDEKRQYRKGYVEMVEEANSYYKNGLHEFYQRFQDAEMFKRLRTKYANGGAPTVQEIMNALGMPSTGKPHEGGISAINAHLERSNRPMLVRRGEWDREEGMSVQHASPSLSHEEEMDDASEGSSDENEASAGSHSPTFEPAIASQPSSVTTADNASRRASAYYMSALDSFAASGSSNGSSPQQEEFLDYNGGMPFYSPTGFFPDNAFADLNSPPQSAGLVPPQQLQSSGTVQLRDVQMSPLDELMNTGSLAASLYRTGHFDDRLIADLRRGSYMA